MTPLLPLSAFPRQAQALPGPNFGTCLPFPLLPCSFPLPLLPAWDGRVCTRQCESPQLLQGASTERAQLPTMSPFWGSDKSVELPVSKRELLARHGQPGSFRSLKYCTTWKNYHWENCCGTLGKFSSPPQTRRHLSFSLKRLQKFLNLAIFVFQDLIRHIG